MAKVWVMALLATLLPLPVANASARPATPQGQATVYVSAFHVTTSTGRRVQVFLQANSSSIDLFVRHGGLHVGRETHDWTVNLPAGPSGLRYNRSDGSGRIDASYRQMGRFGAVHLGFRRTGRWIHEACGTGSASDADVTVDGTLFFRTRATGRHPWGRLGSRDRPLPVAGEGGQARLFDNCEPESRSSYPCNPGFFWQHASFDAQDYGRRRLQLEASRYREHPNRSGRVTRLDQISVLAPRPELTVDPDGSAVLHVTTRVGSRARGSARLDSAGPPTRSTTDCLPAPSRETSKEWTVDAYRNGRHPLVLRADVGPDLREADGPGGTFVRTVVAS